MKELVSILIPNFNKGPYLRQTLDSILDQTYPRWECIIIDDHSTDASFSILQEYAARDSRFRVYSRPVNIRKGACACRNYAFSLAKGEYVNWFDSDDVMNKRFLEIKLSFIQLMGANSAIVSRLGALNVDTRGIFERGLKASFGNLKSEYLIDDVHFTTPGPMFRRSDLSGVTLFDERLMVGQEKEFFFRLILRGMMFSVLDETLVYYRTAPGSILDQYAGKPRAIVNQAYLLFMLEHGLRFLTFDSNLILFYKRKLFMIFKVYMTEKKFMYFGIWVSVAFRFCWKIINR